MMPPKLSSHRSRLHPEQSNQWHLNLWCFFLRASGVYSPGKLHAGTWKSLISKDKKHIKLHSKPPFFRFQMIIFGRVTFGGDGDVPIKLLELLGPFCAPQTKCSKKIHAFTILHFLTHVPKRRSFLCHSSNFGGMTSNLNFNLVMCFVLLTNITVLIWPASFYSL